MSPPSPTTTRTAVYRTINRVMARPRAHWVGNGFHVYPVFADLAFSEAVSPMLMFDYAAPKEFTPNTKKPPLGVGQHPHRGFETVTVAFQGQVEHHDNKGGHGIIKEGDIQWMTAGRGIIHQEYHSKEFSTNGGTFEMAQLWVNLPKEHKMTKPRYQAISNAKVPTVALHEHHHAEHAEHDQDHEEGGVKARIIAGTLKNITGPAKTFTPVNLWDIALPNKNVVVDIPYPPTHACIVFVRRGSIQVDGKILGPQDVALLNHNEANAEAVQIAVLKDNSSVLIMGGERIEEPIAARGPFVMNTQLQLQQAMMDYQQGRF